MQTQNQSDSVEPNIPIEYEDCTCGRRHISGDTKVAIVFDGDTFRRRLTDEHAYLLLETLPVRIQPVVASICKNLKWTLSDSTLFNVIGVTEAGPENWAHESPMLDEATAKAAPLLTRCFRLWLGRDPDTVETPVEVVLPTPVYVTPVNTESHSVH